MTVGRVLITGAAGFLGSHVAAELHRNGYEIVGLDNLSQGSLENVASLLNTPRFRLIEGDVCDPATVDAASEKVDAILHFAMYMIPRYGGRLRTLEVNAEGTRQVLEAARRHRCRVIYASTDDVYGKNLDVPFGEESALILGDTAVGRWSDAASKILGEHMCFAYQEKYDVPVSVVRYFVVYGVRHRLDWRGGAPAVFIERALDGQPLPIHGDGLQTRSFIYVQDAVEGTLRILGSDHTVGEIINLGSAEEVTILNLAYLVWRLAGPPGKPRLEFIPYSDFSPGYEDPRRKRPDMSKARYLLGFAAQVSLEEGLERTIAWHRSLRGNGPGVAEPGESKETCA